MKNYRKILLPMLLSAACSIADAQELQGDWKGILDAGAVKLSIEWHFDKEKSTMSSPDQAAFDIPATCNLLSNDSVDVAVNAIGCRYAGRLQGDSIVGTFTQMGRSFKLNLHRKEADKARPQTPKPPFPYTTEEVSFTNSQAPATLSGTLVVPNSFKKGKTPVVLMVTGSGLEDRNETLFRHQPFLVIADYLARNGIASLRYDDRSYGKSTGDAANATTKDFMEDARAGLTYLKGLHRFGNIGVLGHSEGGTIAFMLAANGDADFIVSIAGMAVTGKELLLKQHHDQLLLQGTPEEITKEYIARLGRIYNYLAVNPPCQNDKAAIADILKGTTLPPDIVGRLTPWADANVGIRAFIALDPKVFIEKTACPVMAINGEKDTQVNAADNLNIIRSALKPDKRNLIKAYPELNHMQQHCTTGNIQEYATIDETVAPEVLADIATWINSLKNK